MVSIEIAGSRDKWGVTTTEVGKLEVHATTKYQAK
jgi:hypothetical protein